INLELILADMETVEKRIANISREVKRGDKEFIFLNEVLEKLKKSFEEAKLASSIDLDEKEKEAIKHLNLLTIKPMLFGFNKRAGAENLDTSNKDEFKKLTDYVLGLGANFVVIDAK